MCFGAWIEQEAIFTIVEVATSGWIARACGRKGVPPMRTDVVQIIPRWALLEPLSHLEHVAMLGLRLGTGGFLVHGVWDNLTSNARMAEFGEFMRASGFVAPEILAPFSVYTQFAAGLLLILGLLTRWAGLVVTSTFLTALWVVHWEQSFREWWPALALVLIGFLVACRGAGRLSLDALFGLDANSLNAGSRRFERGGA